MEEDGGEEGGLRLRAAAAKNNMASLGSYIDVLQPSSSQRFACLGADLHAEAWELTPLYPDDQ